MTGYINKYNAVYKGLYSYIPNENTLTYGNGEREKEGSWNLCKSVQSAHWQNMMTSHAKELWTCHHALPVHPVSTEDVGAGGAGSRTKQRYYIAFPGGLQLITECTKLLSSNSKALCF